MITFILVFTVSGILPVIALSRWRARTRRRNQLEYMALTRLNAILRGSRR